MKRLSLAQWALMLCFAFAWDTIAADHSFPAAGKVEGVKTCDLAKLNSGKGTAVSFVLSNGSSMPLNGFFYSEHLPKSVSLQKGIALIDSKGAKNVAFEKSAAGAVYPGLITHTWIFEESGEYGAKNPLPAGKKLEIRYTLTYAAGSEVSVWEGHCWAGKLGEKASAAANAVVGYCDAVDLEKKSGIRPVVTASGPTHPRFTVSPNPIRGHALIRLSRPVGHLQSVTIVNAMGQTIHSFSGQDITPPVVYWNGCNTDGHPVPTGTYLIRLKTNEAVNSSIAHIIR